MNKKVEIFIFRIVNKKVQYLLFKRIKEKGGFWQPVTGMVENNETLTKAALREMKEETGIDDFIRIIKNVHKFKFDNENPYEEHIFGAEIKPEQDIDINNNIYPEHDKFKWCSYENALKILKWEENKKGLIELNKKLKY